MNVEEEEVVENQLPASIDDVERIFFDYETEEDCVVALLTELPPLGDPDFMQVLENQIEITEKSNEIAMKCLRTKVMESQEAIFGATQQFISLNNNALAASNFIQAMRMKVDDVNARSVKPTIDVLTFIRDLRRDTLSLTVMHFVNCLTMIQDALNSDNIVWAAHTYTHIREMLANESDVYSIDMYRGFVGMKFPSFPTNVAPIPIKLTLKDLKGVRCVSEILKEIDSFQVTLPEKMSKMLMEGGFNTEKYASVVCSYLLILDDPPIPNSIFAHFSGQIRQLSLAYFETQSNDLQTLFRFMESSCGIMSEFKHYLEFHKTHERLSSIVSELPIGMDVMLLERLPSDKYAYAKLKKLVSDYHTYYGQLTHVAESNVLQFLSRLNCTSLDPLSFIRLTRALKTFNAFINCPGLTDWISITASEFLSKYSSVSTSSVRSTVNTDPWVPVYIDNDFVNLVRTMPSDENIFDAEPDFDPRSACASASGVAVVRIIHSLICLSLELDSTACFNLIVQVSLYYVACIMNAFCAPLPFVENNNLYHKLTKYFDPAFTDACRIIFKMMNLNNSLPEQKPPESRSETQLMQMTTATDGLRLLKWYLGGIEAHLRKYATGACAERVERFYTHIYSVVMTNARRNLAAVRARYFIPLEKLKLELIACNWFINEVHFEYHEFVQIAGHVFQRLSKQLATCQISQSACNDIWWGSWVHVSNVLLEAYGSIRACNANGRSLMLSDTRAIASYFSKCTRVEADTSLILEYVNAFFFKPLEFSKWIDTAITRFEPEYIANLVRTGLSCRLGPKDTKDLLMKISGNLNDVM